MYDHEYKEKKNKDREIVHVPMPAPEWFRWGYNFELYLDKRQLDPELALLNGWYPSNNRIVIPCINSAGFNYWQARAMDNNPLRYDSPAIPRKDSIVFLWSSLPPSGTVIICEGPMDALAAAKFYPAIAVMGGTPNEEVLDFIGKKTKELGLAKVILIPDQDNLRFTEYFMSGTFDCASKRLIIPTHKDLAAMPRWERKQLLANI